MRHKVGDKVKVKSSSWYKENRDEDGFVSCGKSCISTEMIQYLGEYVEIDEIITDNVYGVKEDKGQYYWTDEMFED